VSDTAKLDTELLLCHCLKKDSSYLRAWPEFEPDESTIDAFQKLLARRQQGEPVAYLIGQQGFWSLDLAVSPATLIPRPETELLVEMILEQYQDRPTLSVLDLGTGTGAIALALASEKPQWQILGCDFEFAAVDLAEKNRQQVLPANNHVSFLQSNWFSHIEPQYFDIIVSNPPYIDPDDPHLSQGDVRFEPSSALVADNKGLADIEKIIAAAPAFLTANGYLLFEHGYDQGEAVRGLLKAAQFSDVITKQDLAGHDRVTGGYLLEQR
jgi:release factor glutamine methyltransferase